MTLVYSPASAAKTYLKRIFDGCYKVVTTVFSLVQKQSIIIRYLSTQMEGVW